jgi:hypothetical protein
MIFKIQRFPDGGGTCVSQQGGNGQFRSSLVGSARRPATRFNQLWKTFALLVFVDVEIKINMAFVCVLGGRGREIDRSF